MVAVFVLLASQNWVMRQEISPQQEPIKLTIIAPPVTPEPIMEQAAPANSPSQPENVAAKPQEMLPVTEAPTPTPAPAIVQEKVALPAPLITEKIVPHTPAPLVPTQPAPSNTAEIEALYATKIKGYLNSVKRYPTGREASISHPSGKAKVRFILRRNGELMVAEIESSSGSMLLDSAALSTVRRASYTPFPEESWAGQSQHQFSVELDFVPPSSL